MRRIVKNDPAKEKYIDSALKPEPAKEPVDISIDYLMQKTLRGIAMALDGTINEIKSHGGSSTPSRECVANLKDCLSMLSDLKKKEQEIIEALSDDDLEHMVVEKLNNAD